MSFESPAVSPVIQWDPPVHHIIKSVVWILITDQQEENYKTYLVIVLSYEMHHNIH